jgi:hypothetical protein
VRRAFALVVFAAFALAGLAVSACRGKADRAVPTAAAQPTAVDWARPESALQLSAGDAASRAGSFEWEAEVRWTVGRGPGSRTVTATERHRLRQLAGGEFEAESVVDAGRGPEGETGRTVIFTGGTTYGRSRYGELRERASDRGRDARRFRDESFRLAGELDRLAGGALRLSAAGEAQVLGRAARRFTVTLDPSARAEPLPPAPGRTDDPDTKARLELLEGATPLAAEGEVLLDAASGLPLRARLRVSYGLASDRELRADVDLDARVTALGGAVQQVRAPKDALADERKPNGPARALEAAGLRERGRPAGAEEAAPEEEPAE